MYYTHKLAVIIGICCNKNDIVVIAIKPNKSLMYFSDLSYFSFCTYSFQIFFNCAPYDCKEILFSSSMYWYVPSKQHHYS